MADKVQGISKITIKGFKSLYDETSIDLRSLTILAGANSSGKSSIMQPLLLMKQTLESEYTPNIFLLNGPNVKYTDASQFFHVGKLDSELTIAFEVDNLGTLSSKYSYLLKSPLKIEETVFFAPPEFHTKSGEPFSSFRVSKQMNHDELVSQVPKELNELKQVLQNVTTGGTIKYVVGNFRCFLNIEMVFEDGTIAMQGDTIPFAYLPINSFSHRIQDIIHVSGLRDNPERDNPERDYPVAAIEGNFKGTFDKYFASLIAQWIISKDENHKDSWLMCRKCEIGLTAR